MLNGFSSWLGHWFAGAFKRNEKDDTPLHSAIRIFKGDVCLVELLLKDDEDGIMINARNLDGETPLLLAVQNQRCSDELIELLLEHRANVKARTPQDGNTALHWLAIGNTANMRHPHTIVNLLLRRGPDVNARNLEGCSPLHYAAQNKAPDSPLMYAMMLNGVDVNMRNTNGDSPFHLYLQNRRMNWKHFAHMMALGAYVNVANSEGDTPLHFAARNESCDILAIIALLTLGADVGKVNSLGENVYQSYCRSVNEDNRRVDPLLKMLFQGKKYVESSLRVACIFHDVDSARKLLKVGADVNAIDNFGYSPLFYAFFARAEDDNMRLLTLMLLLIFGADVNQLMKLKSLLSGADDADEQLMRNFLNVKPWDNYREYTMFSMFFEHLAKLSMLQIRQMERGINTAELEVELLNESYQRYVAFFANDDGRTRMAVYYDQCLSRCSEELQTMSETEIGDSRVSFLDLLYADEKKTAIYAKNKELLKAFIDQQDMFPIYKNLLNAKLDKALGRQELIERAAVLLSNALQFGDPSDEFFVRTLSYCDNKDLMNVIEALDEIEDRQLDDNDDAETAMSEKSESSKPNGTFNLTDFKRLCISDEAEAKFIPYFERLNPKHYSVWFCEYRYPEKLKRVIKSCGLMDAMYRSMSNLRKVAFGSMCLFGTDNDSTISGIWIWMERRGIENALDACPEWQICYDSFTWTKLSPSDDETKELVKQYFSWTGADKDGRQFNQGRILY